MKRVLHTFQSKIILKVKEETGIVLTISIFSYDASMFDDDIRETHITFSIPYENADNIEYRARKLYLDEA